MTKFEKCTNCGKQLNIDVDDGGAVYHIDKPYPILCTDCEERCLMNLYIDQDTGMDYPDGWRKA